MSPRRRTYDESDVRIRPNPKGSRPRTKDRPSHDDAVPGRVVGVDRGRYQVIHDDRVITAMKARALGRKGVVVGDEVGLVGDVTGGPDALARIVRVEPRRSVLRRTADDTDPVERVIVANADTLVVVAALADPPPRPRMLDRCLVAAYDAGLDPIIVLTKADLDVDPAPLVDAYGSLGASVLVTSLTDEGRAQEGVAALRGHLTDRTSVFVGHSGVGKSTLVNALVPGAGRATGGVNDVTGRGRHTSTSAVALELPPDDEGRRGWIVDTPGVRSFGLAHVAPADIVTHFADLEPGTANCPRGCTHDEPDCALDAWVAEGHAGENGPARLDSLRRLLRARAGDRHERD